MSIHDCAYLIDVGGLMAALARNVPQGAGLYYSESTPKFAPFSLCWSAVCVDDRSKIGTDRHRTESQG